MDNDNSLIVSSDVKRDERLPPRQSLTKKWPVLHRGPIPVFDRVAWTFKIFGLVDLPWQCGYDEFRMMPQVRVHADMHCVTRWSTRDNLWEGVATRELMLKVNVKSEARFVLVHGENGFTTNLPLDDFLGEDCVFAWKNKGQELTPEHGYPLRLVVPRLYAWKSAKWARGIELIAQDQPGFWEDWANGGYHMRGDPWNINERGDGQRFRDAGKATPPPFQNIDL
jgi:DMSO/TMAO reductase YedYZ molybdopterin-dependent catalytic subunit